MAAEHAAFIALALPHSALPDPKPHGGFHVSVFITPKLETDDPEARLDAFSTFRDWPAALATGRIVLRSDHGELACRPLDQTLDGLWPAVFPPDTAVRPNRLPDWTERDFASFPAQRTSTLAKAINVASTLASPTAPPTVDGQPLTAGVLALAEQFEMHVDDTRYLHERAELPRRRYDEGRATDILDEAGRADEGAIPGADVDLRHAVTDPNQLPAAIAWTLHKVRRFYERPESAQEYLERPDPEAKSPPLPERGGEFHERVVALSDHPAVLRRLGLIIDLVVDDPAQLEQANWLQADVHVDGAMCKRTRVGCRTLPDRTMVTLPGPASGWTDGLLPLGDRDRYAVLDIDTDGSGLKSERFFWSIPRLDAISRNGDEIHAAPPALRSIGFAVARSGQAEAAKARLGAQRPIEQALATADEYGEVLTADDVTRGMRIEVWDNVSNRWHSLHRRLTHVSVDQLGALPELQAVASEGFTQGTAATETPGATQNDPVYVHEAMFGWDGWSLAAPRPGQRIRKATPEELAAAPHRTEVVEVTPSRPPDDDSPDPRKPPHPVHFQSRVEPGTLPRLRYGRAYAFRAWQVDLAGNSRPHRLAAPSAPKRAGSKRNGEGKVDPLEFLRRRREEEKQEDGAPVWSAAMRAVTADAQRLRDEQRQALAHRREGLSTNDQELLRIVGPALAALEARREIGPRHGGRKQRIAELARRAVANADSPIVVDTAMHDAAALDALKASIGAADGKALLAQAAGHGLGTVTPLRPFLRWDPVEPPAIVPRRRFTEGESLRVLVIRSGITQDLTSGKVTPITSARYATQVKATNPIYRAAAERHLAPPKTTQMAAELHGKFDRGIGDGDSEQAHVDAMLAWALVENGSFLDRERGDLRDPTVRHPQPEIGLETSAETPQTALKTWDDLAPGDPLAPGQYVVHDVDELALPYLPDPAAAGLSFVFPEAGRDPQIPFPNGHEGFTVPYHGTWPELEPFRLVLEGGAQLDGKVAGRTITLTLPPGHRQEVLVSSTIRVEDLGLFGTWRSLSTDFTGEDEAQSAAADGWLWSLTPAERVLLVHAVPRPVRAPTATVLRVERHRGEVVARLLGGLTVHGPSTEHIAAEATWEEVVDDPSNPSGSTVTEISETAFISPIQEFEELALFTASTTDVQLGDQPRFASHLAQHQFADTKHRRVTYRFRATTRFREYFDPDLIARDPDDPLDDGRSVLSEQYTLDIPSSARPAPPEVHSALPLFRWDDAEEPDQPLARRHQRRAGVRIYLERSWWSSGPGELLAVLLAPPTVDGGRVFVGGDDADEHRFGEQTGESGFPFVSKVGGDPTWFTSEVPTRAMQSLQLDDLLSLAGVDNRATPSRPVTIPDGTFTLPVVDEEFEVSVAAYQPQFNQARGLRYVDIAFDPEHTAWPFVRFAVARFQPNSVRGCELSAPIQCDFVQIPPERRTTVSRTAAAEVRVVVAGPVGTQIDPQVAARSHALAEAVTARRTVTVKIQERDPDITTDLGWATRTTSDLPVRTVEAETFEVAWAGEISLPESIPLRRPLESAESKRSAGWRVLVEEWEQFPADRDTEGEAVGAHGQQSWERRLVYADTFALLGHQRMGSAASSSASGLIKNGETLGLISIDTLVSTWKRLAFLAEVARPPAERSTLERRRRVDQPRGSGPY